MIRHDDYRLIELRQTRLLQLAPTRDEAASNTVARHAVIRYAVALTCVLLACAAVSLSDSSRYCLANDGAANDPLSHQQMIFFESKVRPLLAEKCWSCHGESAQKGGLRLDSLSDTLLGGDSGASVVPGDVDGSLLVQAVRYETYEMPPTGKLSDDEIAIFEQWVETGAAWPGADEQPAKRDETSPFSDEDFSWWAIQPVSDPSIPQLADETKANWIRNDVDRFILQRMLAEGLKPAPEADRGTLIRRLYFDLVGLPPSPAEIDAFVGDSSEDAYEKLVDRLLDSPDYGERWARHWLDLVRYADSDGYRADHYRPEAWRYRDYVIESLNQDKPYDQFVREQIAGDELYPGNPEALVATGYLRNGIYEYNIRDAIGQWNVILNEITDTTGDVFLGLGMQCARCHDHKFDPILQSDYFRLRAYFEPITWRDDLTIASPEQQAEFDARNSVWLEQTKTIRDEIDRIEAEHKESAKNTAIGRFPANIQAMFAKPTEQRTPFEQQIVQLAHRQVVFEYDRLDTLIKGPAKDQLLELRRELAKFDHLKPKPLPSLIAVTDVGSTPPPTVIPKKRKEVQPGTLALLEQGLPESSTRLTAITLPLHNTLGVPNSTGLNSTGRRSELAAWITSPDNPLSVRVIVNRVWQYHFGRSLAANSSDFGNLGGPPSHPELLDYLSMRFLQNGWRLKPLHRLIVTSATYRQSSTHPEFPTMHSVDPGNDWYWRFNTRRLDAEQIRDALLSVTGQLDVRRGGPGTLGDQNRKSIYTRVMRNARDPLLDVFDLPLFFSSSSSRDTTTSPIQSLHLFNNPAMLQFGRSLAKRVEHEVSTPSTTEQVARVSRAWSLVYGRQPHPSELERARRFLANQAELLRQERASQTNLLYELSQMPYRDGQAILFKPEDTTAVLTAAANEQLDVQDFTFETYFQLRSIYDSGAVRTIAASGSGTASQTGWAFGVTGKGSRRKPQTLVIQLFGPSSSNPSNVVEAAVFSDQQVDLNTPYYVAVSVRLATDGQPGEVTFYLKNLADDELPTSVARHAHDITSLQLNRDKKSTRSIRIGGRSKDAGANFDGLIDDIRLSHGVLTENELLIVQEASKPDTIGYWRFESVPGLLIDSGPHALGLYSSHAELAEEDPTDQAFVDLCHVLLNSNSFYYVY